MAALAMLTVGGCRRRAPPAPPVAEAPAPAPVEEAPELAGGPAAEDLSPSAEGAEATLAEQDTTEPSPPSGDVASSGEDHLAETVSDPLVKVNRGVLGAELALHRAVNGLTGEGEAEAEAEAPPPPKPGQRPSLRRAIRNLQEPESAANNLLQAKPGRAMRSVARFAVNSTIGVFGLFDAASAIGIRRAREDFGQTLAVYGVGKGPYMYLPVLGPTTLRDAVGEVVDGLISPLQLLEMTFLERKAATAARYHARPATASVRQMARRPAHKRGDAYGEIKQRYLRLRADLITDRVSGFEGDPAR